MRAKHPQRGGAAFSDPGNGPGAQVSHVYFEGHDVFVFTAPLYETRYPEGATEAERDIIDLLLAGNTPREIAHLRTSSVRTVTTQLAEIYRKAGVRSARELAAFTNGMDGPWTP